MNFVDLFCGGGLGARGAFMAGATPILAIDSWEVACNTYKDNFPSAKVICGDIGKLSPRSLIAKHVHVDLLLASPECTNHSPAKGAAPRCEASKETALHTIRWVKALNPTWIIMENVIQMKPWSRYGELTQELKDLGYSIKEKVLNAVDFGVPQSRKRLFLICHKGLMADFEIPSPSIRHKTARNILDPVDTWKTTKLYASKRAQDTLARAERAIKSLGKMESFLLVYYGSDGAGGWQSLDAPLRTVTTLDRFALVEWQNGEYRMRMLQPSELARAMGLPPKHRFSHGTRRDKVKLCGNGVCAPVLSHVTKQIMQHSNLPISLKTHAPIVSFAVQARP